MVATRRASARIRKQQKSDSTSVEDTMEETVDNKEAAEEVMEEEAEVDSSAPSKNDIGCKKCLEEDDKSESIETHEVETEYDKPDRTLKYLKGFGQRVILCTFLVMIGKYAWPKLQPIVWPEEPVKEGKLYVLTDRSFRGHVSRGDHFIMMYAPWCGHCNRLKPDWEKLAKKPGVKGINISKVDCTNNKDTCNKYSVTGYPTLLYFRNGEMIDKYEGAKTLEALKEYLKTQSTQKQKNKSTKGSNEKATAKKKDKKNEL